MGPWASSGAAGAAPLGCWSEMAGRYSCKATADTDSYLLHVGAARCAEPRSVASSDGRFPSEWIDNTQKNVCSELSISWNISIYFLFLKNALSLTIALYALTTHVTTHRSTDRPPLPRAPRPAARHRCSDPDRSI